jgi:hypothetical protein
MASCSFTVPSVITSANAETPADPNKVIRVEGDFGVSDGKWVVVESGVKAGDEVVLAGVYELKLTGGGKQQGKGHFHADGTWHAEDDGGKK